jgi:hypothetical protein
MKRGSVLNRIALGAAGAILVASLGVRAGAVAARPPARPAGLQAVAGKAAQQAELLVARVRPVLAANC